MDDNKKTDSSTSNSPKKLWYITTKGLAILIVLAGILLYGGYWQISKSDKKIFTEYKPIFPDSLTQITDAEKPIKVNNLLDSTVSVMDTLPVSETILGKENLNPEVDSAKNAGIGDLFKVNTHYEEIVGASISNQDADGIKSNLFEGGLFEELLLPEESELDDEADFATYFQKDIVSSKSVLKLISIPAKRILSGNGTADDLDLLDVLTESKNIVNILLVHRKGKVVFSATNRNLVNMPIKEVLPKVNQISTVLSWYEEDGQQIASIPLHHTYGRIGLAVLITK